MPIKELKVDFRHGLGDCVSFAAQLALYTKRHYSVTVGCNDDKACIFHAVNVATTPDPCGFSHSWPNPPTYDHNPVAPWGSNKAGFSLFSSGLPPLADLEHGGDIWREYLGVSFHIECPPQDRSVVDELLSVVADPGCILFHPKGNSMPGEKNMPDGLIIDTQLELLDKTDRFIVVLDWDARVPIVAGYRVRHAGQLSIPQLAYLMEHADVLVGVDSGPYHLSRMTVCPAVGVWFDNHPSNYALPRRDAVNIVDHRHEAKNILARAQYNILSRAVSPEVITQTVRDVIAARQGTVPSLAASSTESAFLRGLLTQCHSPVGGPLSRNIDRHKSFAVMAEMLASVHHPCMVETGTIRHAEDWAGTGYSTYFFGLLMSRIGGELHTVDVSMDNLNFAKSRLVGADAPVFYHNMAGADYLRSRSGGIDLFYSDSLDTDIEGHAECCLEECQLAADRVAHMIAIDDTVFSGGQWRGKGALAVPWLLEHGWAVEYSGYQTILRRKV